jgi:hypothetical protein
VSPRVPSPFALRPYQEEAARAILREWETGHRSTLLAMATGCEKTEVFLAVLQREQEAGRLGRALIIAHREELVDQPADRIARHVPALGPVGIVQSRTRSAGPWRSGSARRCLPSRPPRPEIVRRAGVSARMVRAVLNDRKCPGPGLARWLVRVAEQIERAAAHHSKTMRTPRRR